MLVVILIGLLATYMYDRYHTIRFPEWLNFFGGKRFATIITSLWAIILRLVFGWLGTGRNRFWRPWATGQLELVRSAESFPRSQIACRSRWVCS